MNAPTAAELRRWGKQLHAWGFNVTLICAENRFKRVAHKWKHLAHQRQTPAEFARLPWRGYTRRDGTRVEITGIGCIDGMGELRDLDLDQCPTYEPVAQLLAALGLPADYPWVVRTGSGNGWHLKVRCAGPLPSGMLADKVKSPGVYTAPSRAGDFDHIELRWASCQTICPPSRHESGARYAWAHGEPAKPPAVVDVGTLLAAWHVVAQRYEPPSPAPPKPRRAIGHVPTDPDYQTAVRQACAAIRADLDLVTFAQQLFPGAVAREGTEVRIRDHGGLLLKPDEGVWYCHQEQIGGDVIDLSGYALYGARWDRRAGRMWGAALAKAAQAAGVKLPVWKPTRPFGVRTMTLRKISAPPGRNNGHGPAAESEVEVAAERGNERRELSLAEISAELEALRPPADANRTARNAARVQIQNRALDLIEDCARLNKADLQRVELTLKTLGLPQEFVRQWRAAVNQTRQQGAVAGGDKPDVIPYEADAGHLYKVTVVQTEAGAQLERTVIADFAALITEEMVNEDESRHYLITGQTAEGLPFQIEMSAEKFADDRALLAAMDAAAGAKAPVRARMGPHLRPAIKLLTRQAGLLPQSRRFERTGWADDKFLIPGRLPDGVHLSLLPTLPYELTPEADLAQGLAALVDVLEALGPERLMIILGGIIIGPIAHLLAWDNERCAYFIQGRTGTLKTTTLQTLLCIWGALFLRDDRLIRWGESGGSLNAIMRVATYVADLPVLIDNYKPSTGGGARGFTNMIHAIVEGSEKLRMTSNSEMRAQRRIACWPHFTGEDCPTGDAASLARVLVVTLDWPRGQTNELLARAQSQAHHLNAIGRALLDWLEGPDCQAALDYARREFPVRRAYWAKRIMAANSHATNPLRIASNLATNELAIHVLRQHPQIGPAIAPYMGRHIAGLEQCATEMANQTADSLEATIFLNTLQELLATGELVLIPEAGGTETILPERRAGWRATDGSVYLLGQKVLSDILKRLGPEALGRISPQTLFDQIKALDLLASTGRDKITRPMRLLEPETSSGPRRLVRVLHLKAEALEPPTDNEAGAQESPAAARNVR